MKNDQKNYDYVIVTHLPAFYKINLYNRLAVQCSIFVIFIAARSIIRTADFVLGDKKFDYEILYTGDYEMRPKGAGCRLFSRLLDRLTFKKIILGGWDLQEYWVAWLKSNKSKLCVAIESGVGESRLSGPKAWLKKIFLAKIGLVFASGPSQELLVRKLGYRGKVQITGGVGLMNPPNYFNNINSLISDKPFLGRFLYLGRFSEEKNLINLVAVFKKLENKFNNIVLTMIGKGDLFSPSNSCDNIIIRDHVPNSELNYIFETHDVLVLPSFQEPWGLVIEEALAYGLPVIVSDRVGCHSALIQEGVNGKIFCINDSTGLEEAVIWMMENYHTMNRAAFSDLRLIREKAQIQAYANVI